MSHIVHNLIWITIYGCIILLDPATADETQYKCGIATLDKKPVEKDKLTSIPGEFPWTIDITDTSNDRYLCAGSLIHPNVVLTAGQCIAGPSLSNLKFRAGLWDRESEDESRQERTAIKKIIHPMKRRHIYDFALIILNEPVTLGSHVNTICLPPSGHVTANGTNCLASGWGFSGDKDEYSKKMKRVHLSTIALSECKDKLGERRLGDSVICAYGKESEDTDMGDSGGPMVCSIVSDTVQQYHQVGIVSFGAPTELGLPGGYANVAYVRPWVDTVMEENGFNTTSYTA